MLNPAAISSRTASDVSSKTPVIACCPSCGARTLFTFIGVQHWPRRVAQIMGTPESTTLWKCGNCQSTISNVDHQDNS